ncbi:MAG: hypothetical protein DMD35_16730, partial [Gemmatimonadetes bacterium]
MAEPDAWVPPTRVAESAPPAARRRVGRLTAVAAAVVVVAAAVLAYVATRGAGSDADATTVARDERSAPAPAPSQPATAPTELAVDRPSAAPSQPAPRAAGVTGRAADPSYGDELRALEESITDSASAVAAMVRVPILKRRVTL